MGQFYFYFPDLCAIYFIFLSFVLDRMSPDMLNKSDESQHHCLVPDHKRKAFSLSLFGIMLADETKFYRCCLSSWRISPLPIFGRVFEIDGCWIFVSYFFLHWLLWLFLLLPVGIVYYMIDFFKKNNWTSLAVQK